MSSFIIFSSIILAILLGFKTKINVGIIAIAFSYIIATSLLQLSPKELIGFWPIDLFFTILAVTLFYNCAITNGTLEQLTQHILYRLRHHPNALYLILYVISVFISAAGAGFFSTMMVCCPIAISLCQQSKKNSLIGAQAVNWGASGGANFITSGSGIVFQGLFKESGWEAIAFTLGNNIFLFTIIYPFVILTLVYLFDTFYKNESHTDLIIDKPTGLSRHHKQSLLLIASLFVIVLVPPMLHSVMPNSSLLTTLTNNINIGLVSILLTLISLMLGLAKQKQIIAKIPWETLLMLCGMAMLIKLATAGGVVQAISTVMSNKIPPFLLPIVFCTIAGIMSLFSSTLSVVTPTLFPIIASIYVQNPTLNLSLLLVATVAGSLATNISPFSAAGSLLQISLPPSIDRETVFKTQIIKGVPICFSLVLLSIIIWSMFQ